MRNIDRNQLHELKELVFSQRSEPAMRALTTLAEVHFDDLKSRLVTCMPHEFPTLQGEAATWQRVLKFLTEKPIRS